MQIPQTEMVKISKIKENPDNPRVIKDEKFKKLVNSIKEFPEMLSIRPIVVNEDMIVLGGNMRLKACNEAKLKEVPVLKVEDLTPDQQAEFIIKDNVGFGEWDWELLANEWDIPDDWGLHVHNIQDIDLDQFFEEAQEDDSPQKNKIILEYTEDDYEKIKTEFDSREGSKEQIVWELLGL